ncbi:glycosyltransferase involved in cell wall biosynthesis [Pullulanibacillus pueri]|uniref:Galactosyl transferase n=1 Tax=Pullulanibacillus pueri TaxID=1437324 RepID=A0A8J2ZW71_9BACL|nr:glycosyltransferase family 2 protein [Pullulanibacillus pueri]MBM7682433.1 glycosyltransferase involved in cell wall biosynthesis [Pullulanibacillus pueri]GGH81658.1 galactosyl transferase [Pullulanibacillus pueri]
MEKKVSIVVPIYKVERYLEKCVSSLLNQTYKNIEVLLVDDGSPDRCGELAETFALKDQRVRVFHKKNGGLSDARNYGLKYVTGDYVMFVDSDDWLDEGIVEEMVTHLKRYQADIVQTAFYYAYDDYLLFDDRYHSEQDLPTLLDQKTVMLELVKNERVKNFAWGKLYRTNLLKGLPFKKGVLFEDVFWAHQVMDRVDRYLILHRPYYYYYQRKDSIVATFTPKNLDILEGLKTRLKFIEKNYEHLIDLTYMELLKASFIQYHLLLRNKHMDKKGLYRNSIRSFIEAHYPKLNKATQQDRELKRQLRLFMIHPYLNVFFLWMEKVMRNLKITKRPVKLKRVSYKEVNPYRNLREPKGKEYHSKTS